MVESTETGVHSPFPIYTFWFQGRYVHVRISRGGLRELLGMQAKVLDKLGQSLTAARDAFDAVAPLKAVTVGESQRYVDEIDTTIALCGDVGDILEDLETVRQAIWSVQDGMDEVHGGGSDLVLAELLAEKQDEAADVEEFVDAMVESTTPEERIRFLRTVRGVDVAEAIAESAAGEWLPTVQPGERLSVGEAEAAISAGLPVEYRVVDGETTVEWAVAQAVDVQVGSFVNDVGDTTPRYEFRRAATFADKQIIDNISQ